MPSLWVEGEVRSLEIVKTREQSGQPAQKFRTAVSVIVEEELDDGWLMSWESDLGALTSLGIPLANLPEASQELFESLLPIVRY